jgi:integrase
MPKQHFTTHRVVSFRFVPGHGNQTLYQDDATPGLGLRVTAAGARSYIFEATLHGRTLRETIGDIRTWTLGKARAEATRLKAMTDRGIDPRKVRREEEAHAEADRLRQEAESVLVSEAWTAYLDHYGTKWGPRHLSDHHHLSQSGGVVKKRGTGLTRPGVLFPLMGYRMVDLTPTVLSQWLKVESASRANNARQGFALFKTFWGWAASHETYKAVVSRGVVDDKSISDQVPARKTHKSDVLQTTQLAAWFAAVRNIPNTVISAYLQALLLTGARRSELEELRWEHVDFKWRTLWLKDKVSKAGREIPLTPYVSFLLSSLPRQNQWVFSSPTSKSGHISEPRIAHDKALSAAKLKHVTLQGLRRTFSSLALWLAIPTGIIDQIVGHAPNATADRHYLFRPTDLLRAWHDKYEGWLLEQAAVRFKGSKTRRRQSLTSIPSRLQSIDYRNRRRSGNRKADSQSAPRIRLEKT